MEKCAVPYDCYNPSGETLRWDDADVCVTLATRYEELSGQHWVPRSHKPAPISRALLNLLAEDRDLDSLTWECTGRAVGMCEGGFPYLAEACQGGSGYYYPETIDGKLSVGIYIPMCD